MSYSAQVLVNRKVPLSSPGPFFCPQRLTKSAHAETFNAGIDSTEVSNLTMQNIFAERWRVLDPSPSTTIKVLPFVEDAFEHVRSLNPRTGKDMKVEIETQVLITGSLHLVGRALGALEGVDAL